MTYSVDVNALEGSLQQFFCHPVGNRLLTFFSKKKVANYQACAMLSVALRSVNPIASLRQC